MKWPPKWQVLCLPTGLVGTAAIVSYPFYPNLSILCSITELVLAVIVYTLFRKGI